MKRETGTVDDKYGNGPGRVNFRNRPRLHGCIGLRSLAPRVGDRKEFMNHMIETQ